MNKHFRDTRYYLERAFQTTRAGFGEELEPVRTRVNALRGRDDEDETERGRFDGLRERVRGIRGRLGAELERVQRPRGVR